MKKSIISLFVLVLSISAFAQKVKIKKGFVLLDNVKIFKIEKDKTSYTLSDLNDNEIIFAKRYGTVAYNDYTKVLFSQLDISLETSENWYFSKYFIKILLKQKVINEKGELDEEKARMFAKKYDENITNRTIRY